jgi:putative peptide zinc metalloprotease protein
MSDSSGSQTSAGTASADPVADEPATASRFDADTRLTLVELSVTPDDDEFIVGDRWQGDFVSLPAIAIVIIDAVRAGDALGEVAAIASSHAGEDVDVLDFAETLVELGFVSHINGVPVGGDRARLSDGGRLGQRLAKLAAPLFSGPAWLLYATLFAACSLVLIAVPAYRPHAKQLFFLHNPLTSLAILSVIDSLIVASHELAHWLAARVQGVPAKITISRRLYLLVFQTDLSAMWALPRRQRFGPLLAGMAFHTVLLTALLTARASAHAGLWHPPALIAKLLPALVLLTVTGLAFQFFVFLRTDLYGVLTVGLGCRNLTRTNQLMIKRALHRLRPEEASELEQAHPQDVRIASHYRWLYLTGLALASWYFLEFVLPWTRTITDWITTAITHSTPTHLYFWESLALGTLALAPFVLPLLIAAREHLHRLRTHRTAHRTLTP